jgi:hypothetical protein
MWAITCLIVGSARSPLVDLWPDHTIFLPCHFFSFRVTFFRERHTMMARGYCRFNRLWCWSLPLHHHTIGDAPYARFRRSRRGGRELPTVPPTPFRRFYALRQPSTDLAGRNRTWRCHPRCDRCRFIHTPWATPPTFGFVGIDGGGE